MNFEEKLMEEVRKNECLYNLSSRTYKDVLLKDKVWQNISLRLGVPVVLCKKRWRTLRDTYKRNKQRMQLRSGSRAEDGTNQWKYFQRLTFLDDSNEVTTGNVDDVMKASESASDVSTLDSNSPYVRSPPSTPLLESPSNTDLEEKFSKILKAASQSIEELRGLAAEYRQERNSSTIQFMIALGNRIERSGLYEDELAELELEITNFVFSKIDEIKNKRI